MNSSYTLYGSPASLYTGKIRAYLQYKNIPFEEVISSLSIYKKVIIPNTGVAMIPVVKTPDEQYLQDSSLIIDELEKIFPQKTVYPSGIKQKLVALLFEVYGDEWLRLPAMHYRWNFPKDNLDFIKQEFGSSVAPTMPKFIQRWLGQRVVNKFSGYVVPLGITEKSIPAIESWYEELLQQLNQHFEQHDFLLGNRPSIGDYGLMGPLYAHLYRDPYPGRLMKQQAPHVAAWVERMNTAENIEGQFLAEDAIPETLLPILQRLFKECWPALQSSSKALADWAEDKLLGDSIPRRLGMQTYIIGDVSEEQMCLPFGQWMMQRPLDYFDQLDTEAKAEVKSFLTLINAEQALEFKLRRRVTLIKNKLVLEN